MNVVDSSGWLEFFADGPSAQFFAPAIEDTASLAVPVISLYEVIKRILMQRDEHDALQAVAFMQQGHVVDLDAQLALSSAKLSAELRLPMADSIILSTARKFGAVLWTQDEHFEGLEGVQFIRKKR